MSCGILDALNGITAIQVGSHEVLASLFDQHAGLARLHVPGVVLDGDFHSQVQRLRADVAEYFDGRGDVLFNRSSSAAVVPAAHVAAHGMRTQGLGDRQSFDEVLFRSSIVGPPAFGKRTDTTDSGIELHAQAFGMRAHLLQVLRIEARIVIQAGELQGVEL